LVVLLPLVARRERERREEKPEEGEKEGAQLSE
jgi:hypothetical protein